MNLLAAKIFSRYNTLNLYLFPVNSENQLSARSQNKILNFRLGFILMCERGCQGKISCGLCDRGLLLFESDMQKGSFFNVVCDRGGVFLVRVPTSGEDLV